MSVKILSMVSDLSENLQSFFSELNFELIYSESNEICEYIIINEEHDIVSLAQEYKDSKFISLCDPIDLEVFIQNSGVLTLDESILVCEYGTNLYSRFFQKTPSVHFREDFEQIYNDEFNFKVSSLGVTGNYSDQVYNYFADKNFDKIKSRLFFNSLITLLSQIEGRVRFPIDFELASNSDSVGMNVSFVAKEVSVDNFKDQFITLFGSMLENTSFLELSFISDYNKLNLCAVWDRKPEVNKVFSLIDIPCVTNVKKDLDFHFSQDLEEDGKSEMFSGGELEDLDLDIVAGDIFDEEVNVVKDNALKEEESAQVVAGHGDDNLADNAETIVPEGYLEEEISERISASAPEELSVQKFPELADKEKEFVTMLAGEKKEEEFISRISSKANNELKEALFKISSSSEESSLDETISTIMSATGNDSEESRVFLKSLGAKELEQRVLSIISVSEEKDLEVKSLNTQKRENALKEKVFELEKELKKQELQDGHQDTLHGSELARIEKVIASKDLVIQKNKEAMENITTNKDKKIAELTEKIERLQKKNNENFEAAPFKTSDEVEQRLISKLDDQKKQSGLLVRQLGDSKRETKDVLLKSEGLKNHIKKLEMTVKSLKERSSKPQGPSVNEKRLEANAKKLQEALKNAKNESVEIKRNFMKSKSENTALKNELDRLKSKKAA